jgi:hypothetical protein
MRLAFELVRRLDHHIGRAGDKVMGLQQPIDRSLGDKVLSLIGEAHRQLARRQLRKFQRQFDDLVSHIVRDAIPDAIRSRAMVGQRLNAALPVTVVPAIECGSRDAELVQRAPGGQM